MPAPITSSMTNRTGLCPHGLPPSACPICNGGGMGGARMQETVSTKPMKSNEWSWIKCYTVGMQMQAQETRIENAKQAFERQIENAQQMAKVIDGIAEKIRNMSLQIQNTMPKLISVPAQVLLNVIVTPILNLIAQIPKIMEKLAYIERDIRNMIQQVGEKLVAVIGEFKNFVEKKVDKLKKDIKKIFSFLVSNLEEENYTSDDALAVFKARELRKYILKILKTTKKRNGNENKLV